MREIGAVVESIARGRGREPRPGQEVALPGNGGGGPLTEAKAAAVRARPRSDAFHRALAGAERHVRTVRGPDGAERKEVAVLAREDARAARPEAEELRAALARLLLPAPFDYARAWFDTLASEMEIPHEERRKKGAVDATIEIMAADCDMPAAVLTRESRLEVIDRCGPWFPAWATIKKEVLGPKKKALAAELRRLDAFLAELDGREAAHRARQKALAAPDGSKVRTEAEVEAWIADREVEEADDTRRTHARQFAGLLRREAPALAERFRGRLEALANPAPVEPPKAAPEGAEGAPSEAEVEAALAQLEAMPMAAARTAVARELRRRLRREMKAALPARLEDRLHRLAEPTAAAVRAGNPLLARAMAAAGAAVAEGNAA